MTGRRFDTTLKPAGTRLRAFLRRAAVAGTALLLAGCGAEAPWGLQGEPARILPGLPGQGWQALPLTRFLTRDTVRAEVLEFCRRSTCGFDAVVARLTATGPEARVLARTAGDPTDLVRLIRQGGTKASGTKPARGNVRVGESAPPKPQPAQVQARPFAAADWHGASLAITGGPQHRGAYGVVLQHGGSDALGVVVTVADSPDLARRLAVAAVAGSASGRIDGPGAMR